MTEIIKFKKPPELTLEDKFIETLDEEQSEMFFEILFKIGSEQDKRELKLINEICKLQLEIETLKGEKV